MKKLNFNLPELYINRELSALEFNGRVLKQAQDPDVPLLERLRFLFICSSNLDEFFEVRVAGIKQQINFGAYLSSADGLSPQELLTTISVKSHGMVTEIYRTLNEELIPALVQEKIRFLKPKQWSASQAQWVHHYFTTEALPIISPIALDLSHPFPRLANKSLNFIVSLVGDDAFGRHSGLAVVHVPRSIPRVIPVPAQLREHKDDFFFLTSIIEAHVGDLFPGMKVKGCYQVRVTRNSDLLLGEEEAEDLALAVKTSLLASRYGNAARLEIAADCPDEIAHFLLEKLHLTEQELYRVDGPVNLSRFMMLLKLIDRPELLYPPFTQGIPVQLRPKEDFFAKIRQQDILLNHPYQSFMPVIELINQATLDPDVLAIKQTLYRTGAASVIVTSLMEAARAGKEVTAVIELRARFEEEHNIELATRLQEAGVLVVYGVVGYKTHGKMLLIVRRENQKMQRYVHLGTGNYHLRTTREYTDIGLLTYDQDIGEDVNKLFMQLTGMGKAVKTKKLLYSPFTLFDGLHHFIHSEIKAANAGKEAYITIKVNALTDSKIIQLLYEASNAGVKIDLIVRGICALRPGIKGISENIRVRSIVDRFLEHSRIFYFYHGGEERLYCSSADWMERNFYHRVEIAFPIEDKKLVAEIKEELHWYLTDNTNSWELAADGSYKRNSPGKQTAKNAQLTLLGQFGG